MPNLYVGKCHILVYFGIMDYNESKDKINASRDKTVLDLKGNVMARVGPDKEKVIQKAIELANKKDMCLKAHTT